VSKYDWLLFLHVTGAFFLVAGSVMAAVLLFSALRRERPSEVALLLGLTRFAVPAIGAGSLLTIVFGLWLVSAAGYDYSYGSFWVIAALVLWVLANATGKLGGDRADAARKLAEQLAGQGDTPSPELRARLHDRAMLALNYGSGLLVLLILVDMIWKPGA
jgi:MFS family permease